MVMSHGGQSVLPPAKEVELRDYTMRLTSGVKSMFENFTEIIKLARIEDEGQLQRATQNDQDSYEMQVRAANIVRAGESLLKLVADLKQFRILNNFPSVNEITSNNLYLYRDMLTQYDSRLMALRDEMAACLFELEDDYYSSLYKDELT